MSDIWIYRDFDYTFVPSKKHNEGKSIKGDLG